MVHRFRKANARFAKNWRKIEQHGGSSSRETAEFIQKSVAPIATNPDLRNKILAIQRAADQTIDTVSQDKLLFAGADAKTTEAARDTVRSFREYIEQHKAEIEALDSLQPPIQETPDRRIAARTRG
jgi:type I restriction enzyme, R subunit